MKTLLILHVTAAGLWLGCVLTEALFERALLGQGEDAERLLARLHGRVDLAVEIPALSLVAISGGLLLRDVPMSPLLLAKIGFGLLALLANAGCIALVRKRRSAAEAADWTAFRRLDQLQHRLGALVLTGLLGALGLGLGR
ncbi:hypothetical protein HLB44_24765 [Aquincola sp. S2]|uniref:Copper resistance protein D domain-containing protein n=1 Tax=Pseudaquabacterium terrae TaxID=2732868 RepID=A0ABX2EP14_9BURK|nr:hypothetical protein [Aquabacterium terrae]NRF70224.1 hypothetical protein [Aquabacterium terrae]